MRIQTSIVAGITIVLISVGLIFLTPSVKVQSSRDLVQREIPVIVKPLKTGDETVPLEIQCDPVFITKADTIERFNCVLINHTDKNIRASSVRYTVISEKAGNVQRSERLDTTDTYIHPDLAEVKKPIRPGGQLHIMPAGYLVEPDSVITALELELIYIEFSDGTTIGSGGLAVGMIADVRDGAAKFKQTLQREFQRNGKSAQAVLPLLENTESVESDDLTIGERIGANAYRKFLLEKYKKVGSGAVNKVLEK